MLLDAGIRQAELDSSQSTPSLAPARTTKLGVSWACDEVIVDHADCLHKRVANSRADKLESAPQQIPAHCVRFEGSSGHGSKLTPTILDRFAVNEVPEIS